MAEKESFRRSIVRDVAVAVLAVFVSFVVLTSMVLIAILEFDAADTYYLISACICACIAASFFASVAEKKAKEKRKGTLKADLLHAFSVSSLAVGAFSGVVFAGRTAYDAFRPVIAGEMPNVHALGGLLMLLVTVWVVASLALGPSYNKKTQVKQS